MQYYLAVDIGASSGRHILGHLENGKMVIEEIYRFPNGLKEINGHLCWDLDVLFDHILEGMRLSAKAGKIPTCMGIDTWGVDFVLLDKDGRRLGDAVAYRDHRTEGADTLAEKQMSFEELYNRTGIQKLMINTIYHLTAIKRDTPELLEQAETFLMIPDYFHYLLTGRYTNEYTNATTSALVNAREKTWDKEILQQMGFPEKLFGALSEPGTDIGPVKPEISEAVGFTCSVVLPATHDTGSAYLAVPARDGRAVYLSSGTWSLLGIESMTPVITEEGRQANITNEGGYAYRYRFLKNVMGLWMIQSVRREMGQQYSFPELAELAEESGAPAAIVDVNDDRFLMPENMTEAVKTVCQNTGHPVPESPGEVLQCIYYSLAHSYLKSIKQLERITGRSFTSLNIVGGGCQDNYLNTLTAGITGLTVYTGPIEGTVIGNLMVQMMNRGEIKSLNEGRQIIRSSFDINTVTGKEQEL